MSAKSAASDADLDFHSETLDNHLKALRQEIVRLALKDTERDGKTRGPSDAAIWKAALRLAPGLPYPEKSTWFDRLSNGLANNTTLLAILTIVFAIMGLIGSGAIPLGRTVSTSAAQSLTPFLDIAKIFAGAIVGSATANAALRAKNSGAPRS